MEHAAPGRAVEVVVVFEDSVLDVRYLRPGKSFRAGADPGADLAWPNECELLRVGDDGRIEPCAPPPTFPATFRVRPLRSDEARSYFGDGDELAQCITLGSLRVLARPTSAPRRHRLSPRIDWARGFRVAFIPFLFAFTAAAGLNAVPSSTRSLAVDPSLVRSVHVELDAPRSHPRVMAYAPKPKRTGIDAFAAGQSWVGTYYCAQGVTTLVLEIEDVTDGAIHAIFDFDFAAGNAAGRFNLIGHFSRATGRVRFEPGAWIVQPSNYVTVGLDGVASSTRFEGEVAGPGCTAFSLTLH